MSTVSLCLSGGASAVI